MRACRRRCDGSRGEELGLVAELIGCVNEPAQHRTVRCRSTRPMQTVGRAGGWAGPCACVGGWKKGHLAGGGGAEAGFHEASERSVQARRAGSNWCRSPRMAGKVGAGGVRRRAGRREPEGWGREGWGYRIRRICGLRSLTGGCLAEYGVYGPQIELSGMRWG